MNAKNVIAESRLAVGTRKQSLRWGEGKDAPDHYLKPLLAQEIQDGITQKVVEPGAVSGYQPGRDGAAELRLAQSGRQQTHQGVCGDPTGRMLGGQPATPEVLGEV